MLAKKNRFSGPQPVRNLQRQGNSVRHGVFSARYKVLRYSPAETKVAVIVSKKVSKKAVVRNRIRRRLFETIRQNPSFIPCPLEISIGVFDAQVAFMPQPELEEQLQTLLSKVRFEQ